MDLKYSVNRVQDNIEQKTLLGGENKVFFFLNTIKIKKQRVSNFIKLNKKKKTLVSCK